MHHALSARGATDIDAYFLPKGDNIHTPEASEALSAYNAAALIVLDQGSRAGPAILPGVPTLILDHHQSTVFPDEAQASMLTLPSLDHFFLPFLFPYLPVSFFCFKRWWLCTLAC